MVKVRNWIVFFIGAALAIITLREFSAQIKFAAVTAVTYIAHISGNDIATGLAVAFNAIQIGCFIYDRRKKRE